MLRARDEVDHTGIADSAPSRELDPELAAINAEDTKGAGFTAHLCGQIADQPEPDDEYVLPEVQRCHELRCQAMPSSLRKSARSSLSDSGTAWTRPQADGRSLAWFPWWSTRSPGVKARTRSPTASTIPSAA